MDLREQGPLIKLSFFSFWKINQRWYQTDELILKYTNIQPIPCSLEWDSPSLCISSKSCCMEEIFNYYFLEGPVLINKQSKKPTESTLNFHIASHILCDFLSLRVSLGHTEFKMKSLGLNCIIIVVFGMSWVKADLVFR